MLTADDMAKWQATIEAPITYDYGRYTVLKAGAWTQGPVTLQQLALCKGLGFDGLDPAGPDFIHLQVEAAKLAFADRETFYGDPKFVEVPIEVLLSDAYNDARRKLITDQASLEIRPRARCEGFGSLIKLRAPGRRVSGARSALLGAGEPTVYRRDGRGARRHRPLRHRRPGRQHGLVDAVGRLAAILSGYPRSRFPPRHPRADVLARRGPSGSARTGQAPALDAQPDLALRDGEPYLAWGTPGGDQQDQWITQFFLRHVHAGMNLQQAIDAPAWHTEHFPISFWPRTARPGVLVLEGRVPKARQDAEEARSQGRGRPGLVGRAPHRSLARRQAPQGRRQSARHAGLRGGRGRYMTWSIIARDSIDRRVRHRGGDQNFAVGRRVPFIAAGIGAIATQALVNPVLRHRRAEAAAGGRAPARNRRDA